MTDHAQAIRDTVHAWWHEPTLGLGADYYPGEILDRTDALAAERDRWKRVALAYLHDPQEYEAAWQDLIDHGDVDGEGG